MSDFSRLIPTCHQSPAKKKIAGDDPPTQITDHLKVEQLFLAGAWKGAEELGLPKIPS